VTYPKLRPCPNCGQAPFLFGYEGWSGGISSWRVECDPCPEAPGGIYIGSCEGRKLDAIRAHNAIATEARRAETENTGSVHGGAGPKDIAR
jgi:hypothetical protein